jgi:serine/threonine protein kinase
MPFYTNGTVQHIIDAGGGYPSCAFSKHNLKEIFLGLVNGLQFMHTIKNLRHNDLKPSNFLLSEENHVVITDFGSVSQCVTPVRTRKEALVLQEEAASKTTPSIRPPELWDCPSNIDIDGAVGRFYLYYCYYYLSF